ncbi:hypothetical protein PC116_g33419, partial [Phytophthora cactorum]
LELAIRNQPDRFSLAMDAIDRMPSLGNRGATARDALKSQQVAAANYSFEHGVDPKFLSDWSWPQEGVKEKLQKLNIVS